MASPLLRSTTTCSVVAAADRQGGREYPQPGRPAAAPVPARRTATFRACRRAAIVLPILWRFGCVRAAKLGYWRDEAVKSVSQCNGAADGRRTAGHDLATCPDQPGNPAGGARRQPPPGIAIPAGRAGFDRASLLRHGVARTCERHREGGEPMGPAQRLHPRPGSRRRLRRRTALRRRHALYPQRRRPAACSGKGPRSGSTGAAKAPAP